jgi:hypothetical protein
VDVVDRYLVLGLRLGRHIDGFVDAYFGPEELASLVDAESPTPPDELADEAAALARELHFDDEHRNEWLRAQLAGCETTARRLAGEPIAWAEEIERCYGVRPEPVPEERFVEAHAQLDAVLPGTGDLATRYRAWVDRQALPVESLLPAAEAFTRELRARTQALFGLPDAETLELEMVQNEPWSAFNYYLGGRRSRIAINTDLPVYSFALPDLIAHEVYPGHHTEHTWKETLLVEGEGRLEEAILLIGAPQSLVSEGIATLAPEIVFGGDVDAVVASIYGDVGVDYDSETAPAVRAFRRALDPLSVNAAFLLHEENRPPDEVSDYLVRRGLWTPERAAKSIEFLTHPTWRAYVSTYTSGYDLCRAFVGDDVQRFRTLLTEPVTTSDLLG